MTWSAAMPPSTPARQCGECGIQQAIGRSLDHYLHTVLTISSIFPPPFTAAPPEPGVVREHLAGDAELDWGLAEHQILFQATAQAVAAGLTTRAWQLLACQGWFLGDQGYWVDWQAAGQAVIAAAAADGDQAALGWTYAIIGWFGTFTGAHDEGTAHLHRAVDHFRQVDDLPGLAWAYLWAARPAARKGGRAQRPN